MDERVYRAAREACVLADLSARELLSVTGPDRVSYLHGMVTNEVSGLAAGASNYAAILTAKGAMVGDVRVLKCADELVLDTGAGRGAAVREFLLKYLISEEAEVNEAPQYVVLGLVGPGAQQVAAGVRGAIGSLESFLGGVDLVLPRERLTDVREALRELPVLDEATAEVLRVERGVPVFGVDMTETTIPLEANLERAVNYTKGCYIGQEVIARATYRGQLNKRLVGLLLGEGSPAPKTELQVAGKKVGWVTSVVESARLGQHVALGYLHRDHLTPGTVLDVAGGGSATVAALPM